MKILLTGYKGFIGSYMLAALEHAGHEVSVFEWGDSNMPSVMEQDWVIHIGAISSTTERDIDKVLRQNFDFSRQLYDACKIYGVNFQYASSASVYGLTSSFNEDAPPDPRTPYAWSKYLFERYVRDHPSGAVVQGFRYFNVYGPKGEEHKGDQASPFYKFKQQAELEGCVTLFEDSENYRRDFIQVNDVVQIQQKFLDIPVRGLYNIGSGKAVSFMDVAKMYSSNIVKVPMPEMLKSSYQEYTCADMTKTNDMLQKYHIIT
jgi:ADP-L-glycero-D-manno-heptose 6-epimerase